MTEFDIYSPVNESKFLELVQIELIGIVKANISKEETNYDVSLINQQIAEKEAIVEEWSLGIRIRPTPKIEYLSQKETLISEIITLKSQKQEIINTANELVTTNYQNAINNAKKNVENQKEAFRRVAVKLLNASSWILDPDVALTEVEKAEWTNYRNSIRNYDPSKLFDEYGEVKETEAIAMPTTKEDIAKVVEEVSKEV